MRLTPAQQQYLRQFQRCRGWAPTVTDYLRRTWPSLCFLLGAALASAWLLRAVNEPMAAMLCLGIGVGALFRELAHFIYARHFWPVDNAIIDWDKVDRLLAESQKTPASS